MTITPPPGGLLGQWQEFIGGPVGHHALVGRQRWWTCLRVLLGLAALSAVVGYATKFRCIQSLDWDSDRRQYASACLSDIVANTGGANNNPTRGSIVVDLISNLAGILAQWIDRFLPWDGTARPVYFTLTALALASVWLMIIARLHSATDRPWALVLAALSPIVWIHAYTDWTLVNLLLIVVAATTLVRYNTTRNYVVVGVILALATQPWAGLILVACSLWLVATGRARAGLPALWGAWAAGVAVIIIPLALLYGQPVPTAMGIGGDSVVEWITVYRMIESTFGLTVPAAGVFGLILGGLAVAGICWWFLSTARARGGVTTSDFYALCFVLILAYQVVSAWWRPQDSLLLVPFAVVGVLPAVGGRWSVVASWMVAEALTWPVVTWHILGPNFLGIPAGTYNFFLLLRLAFLGWLIWLVLRSWQPAATSAAQILESEGKIPA